MGDAAGFGHGKEQAKVGQVEAHSGSIGQNQPSDQPKPGCGKSALPAAVPTLAMGVLGALLSPLAAASLLIVPSMVTNLWQLLAGPRIGALARRLWPMMAASMAGTLAAAPLLASGNGGATTTVLGATLVAYALHTLIVPPFRVAAVQERWLSPLVGLITGVIAGATGVFVIPAVPYLQTLGLEKGRAGAGTRHVLHDIDHRPGRSTSSRFPHWPWFRR